MTVRSRLSRDLVASLLFVGIGIIALGGALRYKVGTATEMGPGWFPAALGIVLILLGIGSAVQTLAKGTAEPLTKTRVAPLIAVLLALAVFAFLIDRFGLVLSVIALVVIACYDRVLTRPLEVLAITAALTIGTAILFVYGLNLPFQLW